MSRKVVLAVAALMVAAAVSAEPVEKGQPMPLPVGLKLDVAHAPLTVCGNRVQVDMSAWVDPSIPQPEHASLVQYFTPGHDRPFATAVYLPDGGILVAVDYDLDGRIDEIGRVGDPKFARSPCDHAAKILLRGST